MSISIKKRIYLSFTLLVFLFVVNGLITIVTLYNNKKLSNHISTVIDPSLQAMNDFRQMIIESKMYSTNWVFLRYNQNDKDALSKLHNKDYRELKSRLNALVSGGNDQMWIDSLNKVYVNFEESLSIEKRIMGSLVKFEDYDNPVIKLEAERVVEDEIIPRTALVMRSLERIIEHEQGLRVLESERLEISSSNLRAFIALLAITFICLGIFLSIYFSKIILKPLEKIKQIINDLGKGITDIIGYNTNKDEIGEMVLSVNNLSEKLQRTATFASEVGTRNFDIPFEPLSEKDTLGKALVAMRNNLKHSDAQLNEAQHLAHLGSWERDLKTDRIDWSDEMFCIFDVNPATFDFSQQTFLNLVHPEDVERVKQLSRENHENHQPVAYECRIVTSKGVIKTIYVEDKVSLTEDGEIRKTSGIAQDITERKKASRALEEAHAELKRLFENIDQAFFSVNMVELKVMQMSVASERIFGYPPEAFYKDFSFWKGLTFKEDLPVVEKGYNSLVAGLPVNDEYRVVHPDKSVHWIEVKIAPTLDKSGRLVRIDGVVNDIGKRKVAELERDRITADLIHRNKDLEQFTYIVSHNLRAPVTNIMALSSLLNMTAADSNNENAQLLNGLSVSINNLDSIILDLNQILAVRTPGYEKKEMVSLFSIVSDIKASIKYMIDKEKVVIDCDFREVENVFALRSYIYSIFYNLILNSIKYKQPDVSPKIDIRSGTSNGKTYILFKDNGKGIDVKKHGKDIFMLYKRFDITVEGKGIGLYMVKTTVETLGGKISLQSELNKGCEFRVELPNKLDELLAADGGNKARITSNNFSMSH
ncbi:MAG: hypothetical protein JWQ40_1219 [Segetibacter sp.]|nr:hypothetical protein [Segetibacter sp.]